MRWRHFARDVTARSVIVLVAAALVLSACSRFERRGGDEEAAQSDTAVDAVASSSTIAATPPASTPDASASTAPTTTLPTPEPAHSPPVTGRTIVRDGVENRSTVDHVGWRVVLTVGDRADYGVDDTILIEVALVNTASRTQQYEVQQPDVVVITPADDPGTRVWSHQRCNPTLDVYEQDAGTAKLAPGDRTRTIVRYPLSNDRDGCRLAAGEYLVFGQWSVCPDEALIETANPGTYRCAEDGERYVDAGPVFLRLR